MINQIIKIWKIGICIRAAGASSSRGINTYIRTGPGTPFAKSSLLGKLPNFLYSVFYTMYSNVHPTSSVGIRNQNPPWLLLLFYNLSYTNVREKGNVPIHTHRKYFNIPWHICLLVHIHLETRMRSRCVGAIFLTAFAGKKASTVQR